MPRTTAATMALTSFEGRTAELPPARHTTGYSGPLREPAKRQHPLTLTQACETPTERPLTSYLAPHCDPRGPLPRRGDPSGTKH